MESGQRRPGRGPSGSSAGSLRWVLLAFLLGLLALLNLDRWYLPLGWVAAPLLIGGALQLAVSLVGVNLALPAIRSALAGDPTGGLAFSVLRAAVEALFVSIRSTSMVVALTGLCCAAMAAIGSRATA